MDNFDDQQQGSAGDDTITGGNKTDDKLEGGAGDDKLMGLGGDDTLIGGSGQDTLKGHGGDDVLYGGEGDDMLKGHGGDDTLSGGSGDDNLSGAAGDDTLYGGDGDDTLDGGEGADTFVTDASSEGTTTVEDFNEEEDDFIKVTGVEDPTNISVEELDVDGDGNLDTVVDLGTGSTLVVKDRSLDDWDDDDYESVAPAAGEHGAPPEGPQNAEEPQNAEGPQNAEEPQFPEPEDGAGGSNPYAADADDDWDDGPGMDTAADMHDEDDEDN
jgi:hypothetical protein